MSVGNIYISGLIGSYKDDNGNIIKGVDVVDVVSQIQKNLASDSFDVYIDSPGGICDVGYKIYDLLVSQKKPIRTIVVGECCSIATVVYLAGDVREPIGLDDKFMIHNPWVMNVSGNADELLIESERIRIEEEKMIKFYSEITGVDKSLLSPLMTAESYMSSEQLVEFNFSTKQISYTGAMAFKTNKQMSKEALGLMDKIKSKLGIQKTSLALQLKDTEGKVLDIASVGETVMIGDAVTIDGAPAMDGSYVVEATGMTIILKDGMVESMIEKQDPLLDVNEQLAAALLENETLKADLAKAKVFEEETKVTLALIESVIPNGYVPPARKQIFSKAKEVVVEKSMKEKMAESKAKYKNK